MPFFVVLGWFLFYEIWVCFNSRTVWSHKELLKSFQNMFFQKKKKANKSIVSLREGGGRALIEVPIVSLEDLHLLSFFFFFLKTLLPEWCM